MQLRYTGMLETVRIRRAGYNVRLTYEEFIQLYRILLPKGLVSSQKDVRDFMHTMDLNKQQYQLGKLYLLYVNIFSRSNKQREINIIFYKIGMSKIYMRESPKMCLDIRLHTKIIDSIIMIQRWFRALLQRRKFLCNRSAAITIQSHWRQYLSAKQQAFKTQQHRAATCIQSYWRMYVVKKCYRKLLNGIVIVQSHIRGKLARINHKKLKAKKAAAKERYLLRPTQSLPTNER